MVRIKKSSLLLAAVLTALTLSAFQNCSGLDSPDAEDLASVRRAMNDIYFSSVPSDTVVYAGSRLALGVTVISTSGLPLSYKWMKNGADLNRNLDILDIPNVVAGDAGHYVCQVTNGTQAIETGLNVTISNVPVITITTQPQPLMLTASSGGMLSVTAVSDNGSALTYQWYKDDQLVASATNSSLQLLNVTTANGGAYHVRIQSSGGLASLVKSNVVQVYVRTTFTIAANECSGSRCGGGYGGTKNADPGSGRDTTDYLCKQRVGNRTMISFTLGGQPGGRFCSYNAAAMTWGCDGSCDGCNTVATVTCSN